MRRLWRSLRRTIASRRAKFALSVLLLTAAAASLALKADPADGAAGAASARDKQRGETGEFWRWLKQVVANDSLSIALFGLFLVCIAAQAATGWFAYVGSLSQGGFPPISLGAYLRTGHFLDGIFSNWQAAILQLGALILLSSVLRQKGAAHSRKGGAPNYRTLGLNVQWRPSLREWLYDNSLSLAFVALFLLNFALHLWFGEWKYNENQILRHLSPTTLGAYAVSSSFWFSVFQCWEAEFGAIGVYVVLSIFLRQSLSSESKPVRAGDQETGKTND